MADAKAELRLDDFDDMENEWKHFQPEVRKAAPALTRPSNVVKQRSKYFFQEVDEDFRGKRVKVAAPVAESIVVEAPTRKKENINSEKEIWDSALARYIGSSDLEFRPRDLVDRKGLRCGLDGCTKACATFLNLAKHRKVYHRRWRPGLDNEIPSTTARFRCPTCGQRFESFIYGLKPHFARQHAPDYRRERDLQPTRPRLPAIPAAAPKAAVTPNKAPAAFPPILKKTSLFESFTNLFSRKNKSGTESPSSSRTTPASRTKGAVVVQDASSAEDTASEGSESEAEEASGSSSDEEDSLSELDI